MTELRSDTDIASDAIAELGEDLVVWGDDMRARFDTGVDNTSLECGVVILPRSVEDVQRAVKWCSRNSISIVTQGGRTGLTGATSTQCGQVVLDLRRLKSKPKINVDCEIAVVSAAITLAELEDACEPYQLHPGIEIGSRGSCTIGGLIATNAGGAEVFRYGMMRQRVIGLEVVLADGSIVCDMPHVGKSNMGIDVKHLFIGSEGTLGIITRAVLRLERRLPFVRTLMIAFDNWETAVDTITELRSLSGIEIAKADIMPWREFALKSIAADSQICLGLAKTALAEAGVDAGNVLSKEAAIKNLKSPVFMITEFESSIEPDDSGIWPEVFSALSSDGFIDAIVAKNEKERHELWIVRDEWATDDFYENYIGFDLSVPMSELPRLIDFMDTLPKRLGIPVEMFFVGHLLDGNVHIDYYSKSDLGAVKPKMTEHVVKKIKDLNGSFSAEHGIGVEKKDMLDRYGDPGHVALMKTVKNALDPKVILNPGVIV
ncbi:MAG: FAD-binding oxidoreductase [Pseudomonadota bacterium]